MMYQERLGLLPKFLALSEATEIPSPSTDLERVAKESSDEGLTAEEPSKEHFGSCSG